MTQGAVTLPELWRPIVGMALWQEFAQAGYWVLIMAVCGQHVHFLVKLPPAKRRTWTGRAKRHATVEARRRGWQGKLWGVRGKQIRIRNRQHQVNTYNYIFDHAKEGAWIGIWREDPREAM